MIQLSQNENLTRPIEPTRWRWFFIFIIVVIILVTIPYIYASLVAPAGTFFTGTHSLSPSDLPVYFSYIEQVVQGQTMFRDLFTSEAHAPFIFNPLWYSVGLLARIFGLSSLGAFHLARLLLIPVFFLVLERWLRRFFPVWADRRLGILLITFGAGFGALVAPLTLIYSGVVERFWPMDLWVTEAYTFLTLYQTPHFIAATTLLLLVLHWFSEGVVTNKIRYYLGSGLALGALMSFHPFHLATVVTVMIMQIIFIWLADRRIPWSVLRGGLIVFFLAGPMIMYQGFIFLWNPIAIGRAAQNINHTPTWWVVIFSYGAFIPLALSGIFYKLKNKLSDRRWWLLAAWVIGQYLVFTIPSTFNRRMTQGWILPLAVFSVLGFRALFQRFPKLRHLPRYAFVSGLFLVFSVSPVVVVGGDLVFFSQENNAHYPNSYYISTAYQSVAEWIKAETRPTDVFLAGQIGSQYIPALAGRPVVFGHTVETLDFWKKREVFRDAFIDNPSITNAQNFIKRWNVKYVLWGGEETAEHKLTPADFANLTPVYSAPPLTLYQVR
jgi:hypothetical protein